MTVWRYKQRPSRWRYEVKVRYKRYGAAGFRTKQEAREAETARKRALRQAIKSTTSSALFVDLAAQYLKDTRHHKTQAWAAQQEAKLSKVFANLFNHPIKDLARQPGLIRDAIQAHSGRVKNSTLNEYRKIIRSVFSYAVEQEYCDRNPVAKIKPWVAETPRRTVATEEEIEGLLDNASHDLADLLTCQLHSAARVSDILRVKREDTDFKRRVVILRTRKRRGGEGEWPVPMNDTLHEVLSRRAAETKGPYLFPQLGRRRWYELLQEARRKAGIKRPVGFHSIRHAQARLLADAGVPLTAIQALLGHQSLAVTHRYVQALTKTIRQATDMLQSKSTHNRVRMEISRPRLRKARK